MYVDGYLLLVIYILAASAVLISVYALWTLLEVEEQFRKKNSKPGNALDHYHNPKNQKKSKSLDKHHWN
jgi:ABC-type nickel/cobalt efflux system permease component RcnA